MDERRPDDVPDTPEWLAFFTVKAPPDLKVLSVWVALAILFIYVPVLNTSPFRVFFALPVILFIPGYVLIAALFPGNEDIDWIERIALSFGLSIAVVPLIGLGLNYTPWGIRLDPIVTSLVIFTAGMIAAAHFRRALLPIENRLVVPFHEVSRGIQNEFFPTESTRLDRVLSIVLLIAIVAAIGTTIFVIVVPKEGEKFTEFYILGEKKMAADYPDRIFVGSSYPMYVGVGNHEYKNITYTVETWFTQMDFNEKTNTSSISRMDPFNTFPLTLSHNSTEVLPFTVKAPSTKYNRIDFLLFNQSVPGPSVRGMDRINASYRDLHLWVKIRDQPA